MKKINQVQKWIGIGYFYLSMVAFCAMSLYGWKEIEKGIVEIALLFVFLIVLCFHAPRPRKPSSTAITRYQAGTARGD